MRCVSKIPCFLLLTTLTHCSTSKGMFHCRMCVSKGRTRLMPPVTTPLAIDASTLPPVSSTLSPSPDTIAISTSLLHVFQVNGHIETRKDSPAQHPTQNNADQQALAKSHRVVSKALASGLPTERPTKQYHGVHSKRIRTTRAHNLSSRGCSTRMSRPPQ